MKLLEKFEAVARQRRLAESTIDAYRSWIQQFLRFSATARGQWTRPEELGTADVESFLNDLVSRRRLSASPQNQAINARAFLYAWVLDALPENHLGKFALLRSTRPKRVPTVLSAAEVKRVIEAIPANHISQLLTELRKENRTHVVLAHLILGCCRDFMPSATAIRASRLDRTFYAPTLSRGEEIV